MNLTMVDASTAGYATVHPCASRRPDTSNVNVRGGQTIANFAIVDQPLTIVLIEHDIEMVMGLCDRIAVLNFGRKITEGTADEVKNNPDVIAAYLGTKKKRAHA